MCWLTPQMPAANRAVQGHGWGRIFHLGLPHKWLPEVLPATSQGVHQQEAGSEAELGASNSRTPMWDAGVLRCGMQVSSSGVLTVALNA